MIILSPIVTVQEINVYVREHTATTYTVTIIDELLNSATSTSEVSGTLSDGILTISISHAFIEDNFYAVQIYADGSLITFQKIYVTSQTVYDKYTVLNDYYTQVDKSETEYIVKPTI